MPTAASVCGTVACTQCAGSDLQSAGVSAGQRKLAVGSTPCRVVAGTGQTTGAPGLTSLHVDIVVNSGQHPVAKPQSSSGLEVHRKQRSLTDNPVFHPMVTSPGQMLHVTENLPQGGGHNSQGSAPDDATSCREIVAQVDGSACQNTVAPQIVQVLCNSAALVSCRGQQRIQPRTSGHTDQSQLRPGNSAAPIPYTAITGPTRKAQVPGFIPVIPVVCNGQTVYVASVADFNTAVPTGQMTQTVSSVQCVCCTGPTDVSSGEVASAGQIACVDEPTAQCAVNSSGLQTETSGLVPVVAVVCRGQTMYLADSAPCTTVAPTGQKIQTVSSAASVSCPGRTNGPPRKVAHTAQSKLPLPAALGTASESGKTTNTPGSVFIRSATGSRVEIRVPEPAPVVTMASRRPTVHVVNSAQRASQLTQTVVPVNSTRQVSAPPPRAPCAGQIACTPGTVPRCMETSLRPKTKKPEPPLVSNVVFTGQLYIRPHQVIHSAATLPASQRLPALQGPEPVVTEVYNGPVRNHADSSMAPTGPRVQTASSVAPMLCAGQSTGPPLRAAHVGQVAQDTLSPAALCTTASARQTTRVAGPAAISTEVCGKQEIEVSRTVMVVCTGETDVTFQEEAGKEQPLRRQICAPVDTGSCVEQATIAAGPSPSSSVGDSGQRMQLPDCATLPSLDPQRELKTPVPIPLQVAPCVQAPFSSNSSAQGAGQTRSVASVSPGQYGIRRLSQLQGQEVSQSDGATPPLTMVPIVWNDRDPPTHCILLPASARYQGPLKIVIPSNCLASSGTTVASSTSPQASSATTVASSASTVSSSATVVPSSAAIRASSASIRASSATNVASSAAVVPNSAAIRASSATTRASSATTRASSATTRASPATNVASSAAVAPSSAAIRASSATTRASSATNVASSVAVAPSSAAIRASSATTQASSATVVPHSAAIRASSATNVASSATVVPNSAAIRASPATNVASSATVVPSSAAIRTSSATTRASPATNVASSATVVPYSAAIRASSATNVASSAAVVPSSAAIRASSATTQASSATVVPYSAAIRESSATTRASSATNVVSSATVVPYSAAIRASSATTRASSATNVASSAAVGLNYAAIQASSATTRTSSATNVASSVAVAPSSAAIRASSATIRATSATNVASPAAVVPSSAAIRASSAPTRASSATNAASSARAVIYSTSAVPSSTTRTSPTTTVASFATTVASHATRVASSATTIATSAISVAPSAIVICSSTTAVPSSAATRTSFTTSVRSSSATGSTSSTSLASIATITSALRDAALSSPQVASALSLIRSRDSASITQASSSSTTTVSLPTPPASVPSISAPPPSTAPISQAAAGPKPRGRRKQRGQDPEEEEDIWRKARRRELPMRACRRKTLYAVPMYDSFEAEAANATSSTWEELPRIACRPRSTPRKTSGGGLAGSQNVAAGQQGAASSGQTSTSSAQVSCQAGTAQASVGLANLYRPSAGPSSTGQAGPGPPSSGRASSGHSSSGPSLFGVASSGQSRTGPSHIGGASSGQSRTGPSHIGGASSGQSRTGPSHIGGASSGPSFSARASNGQPRTGLSHIGEARSGQSRDGASHNGRASSGQPRTGPLHTGEASSGQSRTGPLHIGEASSGQPRSGPLHSGGASRSRSGTGPSLSGESSSGQSRTGPSFNGGASSGQSRNGPSFNGEASSGQSRDGPSHTGEASSGQSHAGPSHTGEARSKSGGASSSRADTLRDLLSRLPRARRTSSSVQASNSECLSVGQTGTDRVEQESTQGRRVSEPSCTGSVSPPGRRRRDGEESGVPETPRTNTRPQRPNLVRTPDACWEVLQISKTPPEGTKAPLIMRLRRRRKVRRNEGGETPTRPDDGPVDIWLMEKGPAKDRSRDKDQGTVEASSSGSNRDEGKDEPPDKDPQSARTGDGDKDHPTISIKKEPVEDGDGSQPGEGTHHTVTIDGMEYIVIDHFPAEDVEFEDVCGLGSDQNLVITNVIGSCMELWMDRGDTSDTTGAGPGCDDTAAVAAEKVRRTSADDRSEGGQAVESLPSMSSGSTAAAAVNSGGKGTGDSAADTVDNSADLQLLVQPTPSSNKPSGVARDTSNTAAIPEQTTGARRESDETRLQVESSGPGQRDADEGLHFVSVASARGGPRVSPATAPPHAGQQADGRGRKRKTVAGEIVPDSCAKAASPPVFSATISQQNQRSGNAAPESIPSLTPEQIKVENDEEEAPESNLGKSKKDLLLEAKQFLLARRRQMEQDLLEMDAQLKAIERETGRKEASRAASENSLHGQKHSLDLHDAGTCKRSRLEQVAEFPGMVVEMDSGVEVRPPPSVRNDSPSSSQSRLPFDPLSQRNSPGSLHPLSGKTQHSTRSQRAPFPSPSPSPPTTSVASSLAQLPTRQRVVTPRGATGALGTRPEEMPYVKQEPSPVQESTEDQTVSEGYGEALSSAQLLTSQPVETPQVETGAPGSRPEEMPYVKEEPSPVVEESVEDQTVSEGYGEALSLAQLPTPLHAETPQVETGALGTRPEEMPYVKQEPSPVQESTEDETVSEGYGEALSLAQSLTPQLEETPQGETGAPGTTPEEMPYVKQEPSPSGEESMEDQTVSEGDREASRACTTGEHLTFLPPTSATSVLTDFPKGLDDSGAPGAEVTAQASSSTSSASEPGDGSPGRGDIQDDRAVMSETYQQDEEWKFAPFEDPWEDFVMATGASDQEWSPESDGGSSNKSSSPVASRKSPSSESTNLGCLMLPSGMTMLLADHADPPALCHDGFAGAQDTNNNGVEAETADEDPHHTRVLGHYRNNLSAILKKNTRLRKSPKYTPPHMSPPNPNAEPLAEQHGADPSHAVSNLGMSPTSSGQTSSPESPSFSEMPSALGLFPFEDIPSPGSTSSLQDPTLSMYQLAPLESLRHPEELRTPGSKTAPEAGKSSESSPRFGPPTLSPEERSSQVVKRSAEKFSGPKEHSTQKKPCPGIQSSAPRKSPHQRKASAPSKELSRQAVEEMLFPMELSTPQKMPCLERMSTPREMPTPKEMPRLERFFSP